MDLSASRRRLQKVAQPIKFSAGDPAQPRPNRLAAACR